MSAPSVADVEAEFGDALRAAGFRLRTHPVMDGRWRRAAVEGDTGGSKSGRYRGHLTGRRPAGYVQNFRDATRSGAWKSGAPMRALSAAERKAMQHESAAATAKRERATEARHDAIAKRSAAAWKAAPPAPDDHPYLLRKGIDAGALRVAADGRLLVPMRDFDGRICGLQTIAPDGGKMFPRGGRVSGLHLLLGEAAPGEVLLISEGFATGATLHAATGHATAVAFSKTNFVAVARTYAERFPGLRVAYCADNDHHLPRRNPPQPNVGWDAAVAAARECGGVVLLPEFQPHEHGSDWNDLAAAHGLAAVRALIEAALLPATHANGAHVNPLQPEQPTMSDVPHHADQLGEAPHGIGPPNGYDPAAHHTPDDEPDGDAQPHAAQANGHDAEPEHDAEPAGEPQPRTAPPNGHDDEPQPEPEPGAEPADDTDAEDDAADERDAAAKAKARSARAFHKGTQAVYAGADFEDMCEALHADRLTTQWMREEGEPNDRREARRIFDKATAKGPIIQIRAGEMHHETTAAAAALLCSGNPTFQRGSRLVRPAVVDVSASKGRTTKSASLHKIDQSGLLDKMSSCITAVRWDGRKKEHKLADIPPQWASFLLSRFGEWCFPSIAGIITTPTLRPDGTVLTQGGYDAATRLYHDADPTLVLHPAVVRPTRGDAEGALALLKDLLHEFPFVNDTSRAVALSGLITPVVRGGMSVVPLHAFRASTPGTGKSYLVDVASAIASGRPCPAGGAEMDSPQETEKRITGMLLAGYPLCSLDNVNGELASDLLCRAVERPIVNLRPLGTSVMEDVECRNSFFITGNNLQVVGDLVRRTIIATLDAKVERPEQRTFAAKPVDIVLADRGHYVSACLVIVRAYIVANRPPVEGLNDLASYEDWSGTVRAALMWLGEADPVLSMDASRDEDPRISTRREVVTAWHEAFKTEQASLPEDARGLTLAKVAEKLDEKIRETKESELSAKYPELQEVMMEHFGTKGKLDTLDTVAFGRWLQANQGVIVDGLRFQRAHGKAGGGKTRWIVAKV